MDKIAVSFIRLVILFGRNLAGCINAPYITYRRLSQDKKAVSQSVFIFCLTISYFLFVSVIRLGVRSPLLLTVKLNMLLTSAAVGLVGTSTLLFILSHIVGSKGTFRPLFTLWSFTLIPTILWFFTTSILYLILPPPRTMSFAGKLYSVVFITFSLSLFLWKIILYYLTLRFAMKLDLGRIVIVSLVFAPMVVGYAVIMYRLGIFRVPFI